MGVSQHGVRCVFGPCSLGTALRKFRLGGVEVLGLERMPYGVTFAVAGEHVGKAVNAVHEAVLDQSQCVAQIDASMCVPSDEILQSINVLDIGLCVQRGSGIKRRGGNGI